MSEQQEFAALLELLDIIEKELGISFSLEEQKKLQEYLKNNPKADPEQIMAEIIALIEKKLQTKLNVEKTKKLKDRCRLTKLFVERAKNTKKKILVPIERIILIIREAEKKLFGLKKIRRELTDKERYKAAQYYQNNIKPNDSPVDKANVSLLGVLSVGIAGGIPPTVRQSWGNLLNAPGYNPYHGESGGGAAIDQAERINLGRGNFDLEQKAIINAIQNYSVNQPLLESLMNMQLKNQSLEQSATTNTQTSSTPTPVLSPLKNPYDPFG